MSRELVNFFYDWTWTPGEGGTYTSDTEGNLVQLCTGCAAVAGDDVSLASSGGSEASCELCGATNNEGEDLR